MKCKVCNKEYNLETIHSLFIVQDLCNNCTYLFQYTIKNVKIKTLVFKLYSFKYYLNIMKYIENDVYYNINAYNLSKYLINKRYYYLDELDLALKQSAKLAKTIIIIFNRDDYYILINLVAFIQVNCLVKKVVAFELIKQNTQNSNVIMV